MQTLASDQAVGAAASRLRASLAVPGLDRAVTAYFTEPGFPGLTFTTLGSNPPGLFIPDDLLAVSLLDIAWRPQVVRTVLDTRSADLAALLADVPCDVDLWDASDVDLKHAGLLWDALTAVHGIGPTSASKLLARKRPRLCPAGDSVVIKAAGVPGRTWDPFRSLLADPAARAEVEALRPSAAAPVSTLRILDVALWISHSKTAAARRVRHQVAMPDSAGPSADRTIA